MRRYVFASLCALVTSAAGVQADSYVSILGGPTWSPALDVAGSTRSMDTGYNLGGRYGYYLGDSQFSLEADGLFRDSHYSGLGNGRIQSSSYMGDVVYHFNTNSFFSLYGGAGFGAVNTNFDNYASVHGGSVVLGWQALGGVEYQTTPQSSIFAEYRYQNAHDVDVGSISRIANTSNILSVGVKFRF